ncbi:hypothetical protein F5884DRAFT_179933 [Xylogone sp. PMI_703]|nr:hypothetical protein F5884DRAFT_179933 [Xylogone sp. PMI_703]
MASTSSPAPPTAGSSQPPARADGQRGGRGRGRGRGRGGHNHEGRNPDSTPHHTDSHGGRRGRGRGGGNRAGATAQDGALPMMNTADLAARFSRSQQQEGEVGKKKESEQADEEESDDICFICASNIVHHSVAPCNHRTCHICALRMRALYKTKDCTHCRTPSPFVIFTDDAEKRYEEYSDADIVNTDPNIGIRYEKAEILEDTLLLLRYNCPDSECDVACLGWPDLHRHVRSAHHKKMCDLCTRHKKVFTHEHELFTDKELERHMRKGDDNPGAVDQSGFKGHPLCGFCGQRFYGDDELYVHCREKHERCFICDRRGGQPQYYVDYRALEAHFRKDHYLCSDKECLEKKFIVFGSEMDLKAHQLEEHGNTLSKDVRRDTRVVDMSAFDYRAPYAQERRGGSQREGRGRGRGRDPNSEPIPPPSTQPLRRDEQIFQRQMAIHSAQSVSTRTFGGQLTSTPAAPTPAARAPAPAQEPPSMSVPRPSGDVEAVTESIRNLDLPRAELTPQDLARQVRHRAVVERASILLQNDEAKMNQFRSSISSYKSGSISATGLIDAFFALFSDTSSNALGTLVREVADLYEDKSKADALRLAWNDWRAINEDYPSLPGPSGLGGSSQSLGWAGVTASMPTSSAPTPAKSTRVLKLKSSTAQSSRSSVSKTQAWGSASASSSNAFPSLPTPTGASSSNRSGTGKVSTMSWANSSSTPSSNPTSVRPTPPTSRPASTGPGRALAAGSEAFPALPPAAKPQSTIFGYGSGMVRRDTGKNTSNAWAGGSSADAGAASESNDTIDGIQVKRKGNKGKKQVLMNWG